MHVTNSVPDIARVDGCTAPPFPYSGTRLRDRKIEVLAAIIRERTAAPICKLLVVGCGSGKEAAVLAIELGADVVGIDLQDAFHPAAVTVVDLRRGDATGLEFADQSFDFVFSFHVLEHIPNYTKALDEMRRVLRDEGAYCIGTPNRLRLAGYLGCTDVSYREKLEWNVADWKARLRGQFRNEFGAHAGFSSAELRAALEQVFSRTEEITLPYYLDLYRNYAGLTDLLDKSGLARFVFPSVYFLGSK